MKKAFTLAEATLCLAIAGLLTVALIPVMTKNKSSSSVAINSCIKGSLASSVTITGNFKDSDLNALPASDSCKDTIKMCYNNNNNSCDKIMWIANHGKTTPNEQQAARKILKASCDLGGTQACNDIVDMCRKDSNTCDVAGDAYDLNAYLTTKYDQQNRALSFIKERVQSFFDKGLNNIVQAVTSTCPTSTGCSNLSCQVRGVTFCPALLSYTGQNIRGYAITTDSDGNIYATGEEYSEVTGGSGADTFVVKFKKDGTLLWKKRYGSSYIYDKGMAISVDNYGNVYLAAQGGMTLLKFDKDGNILWQKYYTTQFYYDSAIVMTIDTSGNIYIAGGAYTTLGGNDGAIVKIDKNGNLLAKKVIGGTASTNGDGIDCVKVDSSGNVYIAGGTRTEKVGYQDTFIMKLDSSLNIIWSKRYGSVDASNTPYQMDVDPSGNIYVAGEIYGDDGDGYLIKVANDGTFQWAKRFYSLVDGSWQNDDLLSDVKIGTDGYVYVVGEGWYLAQTDTHDDYYAGFAAKLDSSGNVLWRNYYSTDGDDYERTYKLAINNENKIFSVGELSAASTGYSSALLIMPILSDTVGNASSLVNVSDYSELVENPISVITMRELTALYEPGNYTPTECNTTTFTTSNWTNVTYSLLDPTNFAGFR